MKLTTQLTTEEIARLFLCGSEPESVKPYGSGHINRTYLITAADGRRLVLQRISPEAFKRPDQVMENIAGVTAHLKRRIAAAGGDTERQTLTLVRLEDGSCAAEAADGAFWRAYLDIGDACSYDLPENTDIFREAGRAFGRFAAMLNDYPADTLHETIPHFHDTPSRLAAFKAAVEADCAGRAAGVQAEIDFVLSRAHRADELTGALQAGRLPLRVTHNDTKLNNVLIDKATGEGLCVLDLDTVMSGLTAYDFGDAIRFGANTAVEDEPDLSKVHFSPEMYQAWCEGYLHEVGQMSVEELASLPVGAWMMTYEVGMRFLTDYLDGDHYFHTAYAEHNLVRARCQFTLLADMEAHEAEMRRILEG